MSTRLEKMKELGLIGCLNGTEVTSTNYKEHLQGMEWISVEERLPIEYEYYLVLTKKFSSNHLKHEILRFEGKVGCVKFWMPLPPPPKEK